MDQAGGARGGNYIPTEVGTGAHGEPGVFVVVVVGTLAGEGRNQRRHGVADDGDGLAASAAAGEDAEDTWGLRRGGALGCPVRRVVLDCGGEGRAGGGGGGWRSAGEGVGLS